MIKSKWTTISLIGQFTMPVLLVFLLALFYPAFFNKNHVEIFSGKGFLVFIITVVCPLYILAQMRINYKSVMVDAASKTITFKMYLLPITKTFEFDYFDGYMEAIMPKDKFVGTYKCYYMVKDNKLKYKMSGRFYSNINELKESISSIPYLGEIKYSLGLSINIALGAEVLVD